MTSRMQPATTRLAAVAAILLIPALWLGACAKRDAKPASDPNTPAVVKGPRIVLPGDTAKPPVVPIVTPLAAQQRIAAEFAVMGAAMTGGDSRMVRSDYDSAATLVLSDTTITGNTAIAVRLVTLAKERSIKDFRRISLGARVVDSVITDSGQVIAVSKRLGADSTVDRGRYKADWRIHGDGKWTITTDRLTFEKSPAPKKK